MDRMGDKLVAVVRGEANSVCVSLDGKPMGISNDGRGSAVEFRPAPWIPGVPRVMFPTYPVLSRPESKMASGALSKIPIVELHIGDLLGKGGFRLRILKCDGANTNKAATRMLIPELQTKKGLIVINNFRLARALSNSGLRGKGRLPYGSLSR